MRLKKEGALFASNFGIGVTIGGIKADTASVHVDPSIQVRQKHLYLRNLLATLH